MKATQRYMKRPRGRQVTRWVDNIRNDCILVCMALLEAGQLAPNIMHWFDVVHRSTMYMYDLEFFNEQGKWSGLMRSMRSRSPALKRLRWLAALVQCRLRRIMLTKSWNYAFKDSRIMLVKSSYYALAPWDIYSLCCTYGASMFGNCAFFVLASCKWP